MESYKANKLRKYIESTETIDVNENLKIRLSKELLEKYKSGAYTKSLSQITEQINQIQSLKIKYPANATPIFYIYIVPNENFKELLDYPLHIQTNGGGKPVSSYDIDGFNRAYGVSSNILEKTLDLDIMRVVNNIHELSHLVCSMFFNYDLFLSEGFAEAIPLYTMGYEDKFDEHREVLKSLPEEKVLSAGKLLELTYNYNFNTGSALPNKSCSFDYSYISSYLFVRGCIEKIEERFGLNKIKATQTLLEIIRSSLNTSHWLVYDIANYIGIDKEELLNGKTIQLEVLRKLS